MVKILRTAGLTFMMMAGLGPYSVFAAETGAAPVTWQPESPLYQLDTSWTSGLFLVAALGILLGLGGRPWFNLYRDKIGPGQVLRHRALHAVLHWLNAVGFILALLSGAMILKWVRGLSQLNTYRLHFVGAMLIVFSIGAVAIRALVYEPKMHPIRVRRKDLRELRQELLAYLGLAGGRGFLGYSFLKWPGKQSPEQESRPNEGIPAEKYLATERVISYPLWVIISGVLIVTGMLKALRYLTGMPQPLLAASTKLHDWAAWAAVAMLVLHAGAVLIIKTNWPLLKSMFVLTVPEKFAQDK